MLWDAGQERRVRERDERLVESFVTARDAHVAVLAREPFLPEYVKAHASARPSGDRIAARDRTLRMLGATFPGSVKVS